VRTSALIPAVLLLATVGLASPAAALPAAISPGSDGGQVCKGMSSGKIEVEGSATSVAVTAPEGQLIVGYCVKAGSVKNGLGPRYVELEEPVTSVTLTYEVDGKARDISHYALDCVDATLTAQVLVGEAPTVDVPSEKPTDDNPSGTSSTEGAPDEATPGEAAPEASSVPTPQHEEAANDDAEPVAQRLAADVEAPSVGAEPAASSLPVTGAEVGALALAALALVGAGSGAVWFVRRRTV
jgi:LPXTG-motif cell wall-anchored protein